MTGYVDDVRQASTCLEIGMRYDKEMKSFKYTKEAEEEDKRMKI